MKTQPHLERKEVIAAIEEAFTLLETQISAFDDETINQVPFEGSWTAGQTVEHIIRSGSGIPDQETEATDRPADEKLAAIEGLFLDFNIKFQAAPQLQPGTEKHSGNELMKKVLKMKQRLLDKAGNSELGMLCTTMELPTFGYLTRLEWLMFITIHTRRHIRQLNNIYAHLIK